MNKVCILMGSPRRNGNTNAILRPFSKQLEDLGCDVITEWLYDKHLKPCVACRECQKDWENPSCIQEDDMKGIFDKILACDLIVLATPVYSWYCTAPMKTVLDRLVYAMNKYYGNEKGPSIWAGKKVAIITTCGYSVEKGADLLEEGIKRYCKHSALEYVGILAERHLGYDTIFMDEEKEKRARSFAKSLYK